MKKLLAKWLPNNSLGALFPLLCAFGGAIFMGISPILVRGTHTGPIITAFYRVFFALPFLWIWFWQFKRRQPANMAAATPQTKEDFLLLALAGVLLGTELCLWYGSLAMTSVVNSTLLNNFSAFFVPIIVWLLFAERPTLLFLASTITALIGTYLLASDRLSLSSESFQGDLLALTSGLILSGYYIAMEKLRKKFSTPVILWWSSLACSIVLLFAGLSLEEQLLPSTLYDCLGFLILALFIHVGGQGFLTQAIGHFSASILALAFLISPVISASLAWIVYEESISLTALSGACLILCSLFLAQKKKSESLA